MAHLKERQLDLDRVFGAMGLTILSELGEARFQLCREFLSIGTEPNGVCQASLLMIERGAYPGVVGTQHNAAARDRDTRIHRTSNAS